MTIVRALAGIAATLIILIVAGVFYLSFADLTWLKPRIESAVADATGRRLQLGGAFDIDIVPSPAIVLEDVSLSNAEWGSEPMLATIGHASARLDFWSLLAGPVRVNELRLRDIDVLLETSEQGESNWTMGAAAAEPVATGPADTGSEAGGVPVIIELAELRNIKLRYQAPEARPFVASLVSLDISTDPERYTVLEGAGEIDKLPLRLAGRLGPARALAAGAGIGVDLNAGLGNVDLDIDGSIGDLADASGIDLKAVASSDDVTKILKHFAVDLPLSGALHLETTVTSVEAGTRLSVDARVGEIAASAAGTQQDNTVSFEAAVPSLDKVGETFQVAGLPAENLAVDGRIVVSSETTRLHDIKARLGEAELKLDGSIGTATDSAAQFVINAKGPSLAGLNTGLPAIPFTAAMTASVAPEALALDDIEATFGASDLAGSIEVATGDKTAVAGRFKSKHLDLTPFAGDSEEQNADKATAEAERDTPQSKYVFVEEPLPFEELKKTDIDIEADIDRFTLDRTVLLDVVTTVDLKDGDLRFSNRFRGPEGGKSSSDISLSNGGKSATLDVNVNMRDVHLNLMSGEAADVARVPPVGITVAFKANGASPRALASSANGRVLVTQGKGRIQNNLVGRVSGDLFAQLFKALNPFSKDEEFTVLDCTIVALDIKSGKADIDALYSQGEKIKIVGGGDIDLNTEKLNIEFNTKPRKGVGVSADMFVTPFVKVVGTLASPTIGVDKKGALLAGATVATGGLALLAKGVADRAAGETDRCAEILAEVGGHPPLKQ